MNKQFKTMMMLAVVTALLVSCKQNTKKDMTKETEGTEVHHGLDLQYMDTTESPAQNFYKFVNGNWMKQTKIPSDHKSWGSFYKLRKETNKNMLALLNKAKEDNEFKKGSDRAKAIEIYQSQLDTAARNHAGLAPLKPIMKKIEAVSSLEDLQKLMENYPAQVGNPFFGIHASPKPEESSMNGTYLFPGSLGLPDRDYYTNQSSHSKKVRKEYVKHITRMFTLWGNDEADAHQKAKQILALETQLAKPRMPKEERRDPKKRNNPRSIEQISEMLPAINWDQLIANLPVKKQIDTMIVTQLKYIGALQGILTHTDIDDLKTLVSWTTLNGAASYLTTNMGKANWDFYSHTLNGVPQQRPADERALSTVNSSIGDAVGKIYVGKYFPPQAKKTAENMIHDVIEAYKIRIHNLDWMSDSTKKKAIHKLSKLTIKIGYPDKWKDYSNMEISKDSSFYANMVAASKWHLHYNLSKINEPVDTTEWFMNPQTVNAYNNPQANEIVFPAAILQPPFYDYKADPAVNFGGMGAVIGHEITHSFDDQGAKYDANGNLHNWWTKTDLTKFKKRTKKLADFYSSVKVSDSLHLNGKYTLGENTADLGGVLAAFGGMERYFKNHKKPGKIDGYTQKQRFFMSWATVWRTKVRPQALRTQIKNDPHSPGYYRSYLPLENVDAFYKAFNIKPGDSMYVPPKDRVRIW